MKNIIGLMLFLLVLSFWSQDNDVPGPPFACNGLSKIQYDSIRLCKEFPYDERLHISDNYSDSTAADDVSDVADLPGDDTLSEQLTGLPDATVQRLEKLMQARKSTQRR